MTAENRGLVPDLRTAIAMTVPEVDALVAPWRLQHDPSAREGIGAHVSLLVPFKPIMEITDEVIRDLARLFAGLDAPRLEFAGLCAFPNVLYLAPEPRAAVDAVIAALRRRYPEVLPYGGAFAEVIPHLTVGYFEDESVLLRVAEEVGRALAGQVPVRAVIRHAELWEPTPESRWRVRAAFPFQGHRLV